MDAVRAPLCLASVVVAVALAAGCASPDRQLETRLVYGPWVHHVAINESALVSRNLTFALPFEVTNRTAHDATNVSFSFASPAPLTACITNGTIAAGPAENSSTEAALRCASGVSAIVEGIPAAPGRYTLVIRCDAPSSCDVRYSLRIEGTGDPVSR